MRYRLYDVTNNKFLEAEINSTDTSWDNKLDHVAGDPASPEREVRWVPVTASHEFLKLNYDANTDKYSLDEDTASYEADLMAQLRKARDEKLLKTDWIKLPDVTLSNEADWDTYRQALRDMPANVDKFAILEAKLNSASSANDVQFKAAATGESYNSVEIEIIAPNATSSLSVSVTNKLIQITLAHDGNALTSTLQDVVDAINNDASASALVSASIINGALGTILVDTALSKTALSGGESIRSYSWPTPPSTPVIDGL